MKYFYDKAKHLRVIFAGESLDSKGNASCHVYRPTNFSLQLSLRNYVTRPLQFSDLPYILKDVREEDLKTTWLLPMIKDFLIQEALDKS